MSSDVYQDLLRVGQALGINGFANITCIESKKNGQRYFIEADLRPNVWIDYGKFIGDDAATALKNYFFNNQVFSHRGEVNPLFPKSRIVCFIPRMSLWELMTNQYDSWNSFDSGHEAFLYIWQRATSKYISQFKFFFYSLNLAIRVNGSRYLKPHLPPIIWSRMAYFYRKLF